MTHILSIANQHCGRCHKVPRLRGFVYSEGEGTPPEFACLQCFSAWLERRGGPAAAPASAAHHAGEPRLVIDVNLCVKHQHTMDHANHPVERNGQLAG